MLQAQLTVHFLILFLFKYIMYDVFIKFYVYAGFVSEWLVLMRFKHSIFDMYVSEPSEMSSLNIIHYASCN